MAKTAEWLRQQYSRIGGSSAATVLGKHPFGQTRKDLFELMRNPPEPRDDENDDMRRGRLLEPVAFDILMEQGRECTPHNQMQFIRLSDKPFAQALPDGWELDSDGKSTNRPVEIKWPRPAKFQRILLTGLPEEYLIQAQHNLAMIPETQSLLFVVCCPVTTKAIIQDVYRNERFIQDLMDVEHSFYNMVKKGECPPDDDPPKVDSLPESEGEMIVVDTPAASLAAKVYVEAKELLDESKELIDNAKSQIADIVGDSRIVELHHEGRPVLRVYNTELAGRRSVDIDRLQKEFPEVYEKVLKVGQPTRPMRPYVLGGQR